MIYESQGLFRVLNPCVIRGSSSLMIYESLGLFGLPNPCVSRDSSSLIIFQSLRAICVVESMCHQTQQFG
jgi:hypothetical protein